jgi:hypothetical protein
MEFVREFNIKNIDWENFESKVIHTQPFWRQRQLPMPENVVNRYASKIKHRILTANERFDHESVTAEFQQFLLDGEAAIEEIKKKKLAKSVEKENSIQIPSSSNSSLSVTTEPTLKENPPKFQFCTTTTAKKNTLFSGNKFNSKAQKPRSGHQKNASSSRNHQQHNDKQFHPYRRQNKKMASSSQNHPHDDFTSILHKTK